MTFALGTGANTAVFSLTSAVLLEPMPYPDPERLMRVYFIPAGQGEPSFKLMSYADYADIMDVTGSLEAGALHGFARLTLTGSGDPVVLNTARVTATMIPLLGVRPVAGRAFSAMDDRPGADPVVMLSHSLWQRRFGGDTAVVGNTITLDQTRVTVVGILPPDAAIPREVPSAETHDAWVPLRPYATSLARDAYRFAMYARASAGVSQEGLRQELDVIAARLAAAHPGTNAGVTFSLLPAREQWLRDARPLVFMFQAAVTAVLLIACANVAGLMLAASLARRRDMGVRRALGAGRVHVMRAPVAACLVLAVIGGAVGLLLAHLAVEWYAPEAASRIPRAPGVGIDLAVLAVTGIACVGAGVLAGLVPAWHASSVPPSVALSEVPAGITRKGRVRRLRYLLVAVQVAATFPLLVAATLLAGSMWRLANTESGLDPAHVTVLTLDVPPATHPGAAAVELVDRILGQMRGVPGILSAGATSELPFDQGFRCVEYQVDTRPNVEGECAEYRVTTSEYLDVLGVPLLRGRYLDELDAAGTQPVTVVNRIMAERLWPGLDPIGREIRSAGFGGTERAFTVVGVMGDVRQRGFRQLAQPEFHVSRGQERWSRRIVVAARSSGPAPVGAALREAVWSVDREVPVEPVSRMTDIMAASLTPERLRSGLTAVFSAVALLLSVIGIFGVASHSVNEQTREIGIRLALGASASRVRAHVMLQSLRPVALGLLAGAPFVWLGRSMLEPYLFGVGPADPVTVSLIALVLVGAAVIGSWVPAAGATRVDPSTTIRGDTWTRVEGRMLP